MELVLRQWAHLEKHKDVPGREEILVSGSRLGLVPVCFSLFSSQEVLFSIVSVFCQIWEFPREWLLGECGFFVLKFVSKQ